MFVVVGVVVVVVVVVWCVRFLGETSQGGASPSMDPSTQGSFPFFC